MLDWEKAILNQLDAAAKDGDFPMLDNAYLRNAGVRLTVFRSSKEWLMMFEELAVSDQHGFVDAVSAYGNRVDEPGTQEAVAVADQGDGSVWDEDMRFQLDPKRFTVPLPSGPRTFTPSVADYRRAGIEDEKTPAAVRVLRLLAAEVPEELYLRDDELLAICGRSNAKLERFMQLDGWHHPDVANDELPGATACFRTLARAIAEGDPSLYNCPEDSWNTHWSNWESSY